MPDSSTVYRLLRVEKPLKLNLDDSKNLKLSTDIRLVLIKSVSPEETSDTFPSLNQELIDSA